MRQAAGAPEHDTARLTPGERGAVVLQPQLGGDAGHRVVLGLDAAAVGLELGEQRGGRRLVGTEHQRAQPARVGVGREQALLRGRRAPQPHVGLGADARVVGAEVDEPRIGSAHRREREHDVARCGDRQRVAVCRREQRFRVGDVDVLERQRQRIVRVRRECALGGVKRAQRRRVLAVARIEGEPTRRDRDAQRRHVRIGQARLAARDLPCGYVRGDRGGIGEQLRPRIRDPGEDGGGVGQLGPRDDQLSRRRLRVDDLRDAVDRDRTRRQVAQELARRRPAPEPG